MENHFHWGHKQPSNGRDFCVTAGLLEMKSLYPAFIPMTHLVLKKNTVLKEAIVHDLQQFLKQKIFVCVLQDHWRHLEQIHFYFRHKCILIFFWQVMN